jgi:hypothetical protein
MLLHAFTWQQFLVAAFVFSLVWLAAVALLYYRKELNHLASGTKPKSEPLSHAWDEDFEPLGKPALPDGVAILEQDEFSFAPAEEALVQGNVFDLMAEVKPLLTETGLDKESLIERVNHRVRDYPRLMASPLLATFYEEVCERVNGEGLAEFELSVEELKENL